MRGKLILLSCVLLFFMAACAPTAHFGIPDKAVFVPGEFGKTEEAVARAEKSEGAKYCPDKIAKAKELGKKGVETFWACNTVEGLGLLAQAGQLAKEAESCQPPPKPAPAPAPAAPKPAPAPAAAPPPAKKAISFHGVFFDFDKANLKPEAKAELDRAAKIMQDNPDVVLELQGYTDATGDKAYNKTLGDRRAKAVFDYLKSKGIKAERLKTVSFGETNPIAPNTTKEGRAKNRRVELVILK